MDEIQKCHICGKECLEESGRRNEDLSDDWWFCSEACEDLALKEDAGWLDES